ncbi:EAL domain-containing protein [Bordetella sp. FB-8]|uniref:bifunctional diguanylate cyclase/phosphodiesterase n=1 Tax=Bordetella sp. FB-8 TaxID=1159870 RepID=UPI00036C4CD6|nr:EAL domain-containing protein [Bordetella sp. FB-8]
MQNGPASPSASSFSRALVSSIVGLLLTLGLALLIAIAWQGVASTEQASRQEIKETLERSADHLQALVHAAELTARSVERVARTDRVDSATLLPALQTLQAAFDQQPDLSYLGIVLPKTGEYGNLERTADGTVLLWLFPGNRPIDPTVRNFVLTDTGFVPHLHYPTDGYDPRKRPFYQAALADGKADGIWMPAYRWIVHTDTREELWGFSYVKALRNSDGTLLCVIDTDFDMPALNRFLRSLSKEYHAQLRVVELGPTPRLIGAPGANAMPLPLPKELAPLARSTSGAAVSVDRISLDGTMQWVAARRIALKGGISWLLVVSRAAPFIEMPLRHQLYAVLGMGMAIALGLVLLSVRIARRFGMPLAELERRVAAIGQPAVDPPQARTPSSVNNFLETKRLGESLDRMIAEREQAEANLRALAMYDHLTGLANRNLIEERIATAIVHARRHGTLLALLYIDLDRFKVVNDGYGHLFGDAVLRAVAKQLAELVRPHDTVARLGGDEFLILLTPLTRSSDAGLVARKIVACLDSPLLVQDRKIHLSGSVGVSVFPKDGETGQTLVDNADMAMYRAKELGRNTWQFFAIGMSLETQHRVDLEIKLQAAIGTGQLSLAYQPKINLDSGRITGCEALLRWRHPELGDVPPDQFIPIAEDSGLIVPIGDWVLRMACMQARAWMQAGLPCVCVAVNLSVRQFLQQDVIAWVARTLQDTQLPPGCLELELTESLIAQDAEKVVETIDAVKKLGVKLSIDDFGTGYSSLNYLKRFRVDTLKIDQSFVRNMLTEKEDEAIVQAVIALAHTLNFKVIAEGVETEQHYRFLSRHNCDEIQGYYFSPPVTAEEFADMLREGKRLI